MSMKAGAIVGIAAFLLLLAVFGIGAAIGTRISESGCKAASATLEAELAGQARDSENWGRPSKGTDCLLGKGGAAGKREEGLRPNP